MYNDPLLVAQIKRDEGRSAVVYKDTRGLWTIGDGILVDPKVPGAGLRSEEMDFITNNRIGIAAVDAMNLVGPAVWAGMGPIRRRALIDMCYNLGATRLAGFHDAIAALKVGKYAEAAVHMKASLWYHQVGKRAERICNTIATGMETADA